MIQELENSNIQLAESRSAVEELEEKLGRISKLREDYSELQATSKSTILCLEDEMDTLKRQDQNLQAQLAALISHPNLGSLPPPALTRLLFNQDQELAAARQRDQTQDQSLLEAHQHLKDRDQDLSKAQQRCQALGGQMLFSPSVKSVLKIDVSPDFRRNGTSSGQTVMKLNLSEIKRWRRQLPRPSVWIRPVPSFVLVGTMLTL
ncbi:Hypothetical protein PHPALM_7788 [Phytophthora palmivora]|uniref:Uncharacterized protein n=1 Tax=Phytophthora palmivora TaxID=4796 RepID=A0A2P4YBF1_9STRA|nr:Hypothetical protein PHPALM_7788 [Phytophthora palmivora]